jgi:hypothetical protein
MIQIFEGEGRVDALEKSLTLILILKVAQNVRVRERVRARMKGDALRRGYSHR